MDNMDFIFSNKEYTQLKNEYNNLLTHKTNNYIYLINDIIFNLNHTHFQMPPALKNRLLCKLFQAQNILDILFKSSKNKQLNTPTNPFGLINQLSILSKLLNSHSFKSPFQTLCLKCNNLLLTCIEEISNYFMNKI